MGEGGDNFAETEQMTTARWEIKIMKFQTKADTNPNNSNCKTIHLGGLNAHIAHCHWYLL